MNVVFYLAAAVAVVSTAMVITRLHAVHALLYLIVSLLSVALIFYVLGAPFVAALEVIIYAGAIMVLFIFVVMMLNLGEAAARQERQWVNPKMWVGPAILAAILVAELVYTLVRHGGQPSGTGVVGPKEVGIAVYGPYLIGVELVSLLLLAALVAAYHLGQRRLAVERRVGGEIVARQTEERYGVDPDGARAATGHDAVRAGADRAPRTP
ncbi:MAG TPA: NADH-quinone oxidoreductase subunit J [Candidatus Tectomicrobia bacterium]|jgi:NADH-quinone oxidoreductase subunit J|nr:NADH-quinone oxidoreductase subunit J [Candidatus Tectomicrobia bacterium]